MSRDFVGPCGLYCGACLDNLVNKECHGCGCDCGNCAGEYHFKHCSISQCAAAKGIATCAECADFPCTNLIQFAFGPFVRHHLPVLENLRRIQRIGVEKWLEEQKAYFADEENRRQWVYAEEEGGERYRAWKARDRE